MVAVYGHWIVPTDQRLQLHEMAAATPDRFALGKMEIFSVPSAHSGPSLSYRIEAEGSSVTISGDTDVTDNLAELARGTDVLICECSMPEGRKIPGHLVPSEAGDIARRAGVKRLVLTHFYPPCDEVNVAEQAARTFLGEITRAEDLMVIAF
jgi:ribonuclease BN (tRNA processing enzyme)